MRGRTWRMLLVVAPAALAFVGGVWQFVSLPGETGPRVAWWLLPAIALVCAVVAVAADLPDGRWLGIEKGPNEGDSNRVSIVFNWLQDMERRLPRQP